VVDIDGQHRTLGDFRWLDFFPVLHEFRFVRAIDGDGLLALDEDDDVLIRDLL
jgi:hypothetical protein